MSCHCHDKLVRRIVHATVLNIAGVNCAKEFCTFFVATPFIPHPCPCCPVGLATLTVTHVSSVFFQKVHRPKEKARLCAFLSPQNQTVLCPAHDGSCLPSGLGMAWEWHSFGRSTNLISAGCHFVAQSYHKDLQSPPFGLEEWGAGVRLFNHAPPLPPVQPPPPNPLSRVRAISSQGVESQPAPQWEVLPAIFFTECPSPFPTKRTSQSSVPVISYTSFAVVPLFWSSDLFAQGVRLRDANPPPPRPPRVPLPNS